MTTPVWPHSETHIWGVHVCGSCTHGYFATEAEARAYQKRMHETGCYCVYVFRPGDGSNFENA